MNNKDFLLSVAAGRGSKPRFKLSRLKQFSSARRTLLVAAKAMFLGRRSSGFARAIDCEKTSDWCCSMNQKPIASCEFLLWESQQTFSSSVYCCEFTASIALHNFGFSFESLLRSPSRYFLFGRKRTVTRMVSVTTPPRICGRGSV